MHDLAHFIDHTALQPTLSSAALRQLCEEAGENGFPSVCVPQNRVADAASLLEGSAVATSTVISFPFGDDTPMAKVAAAVAACRAGATELDVVWAIGRYLDRDLAYVARELEEVVSNARGTTQDCIIKVIVETAYLDDAQKREAVGIVADCGADFIKTSTGHAPAGATPEDVQLFSDEIGTRGLGGKLRIKAAGGIRTAEAALALVYAGADRIGTSAGLAILEGSRRIGEL